MARERQWRERERAAEFVPVTGKPYDPASVETPYAPVAAGPNTSRGGAAAAAETPYVPVRAARAAAPAAAEAPFVPVVAGAAATKGAAETPFIAVQPEAAAAAAAAAAALRVGPSLHVTPMLPETMRHYAPGGVASVETPYVPIVSGAPEAPTGVSVGVATSVGVPVPAAAAAAPAAAPAVSVPASIPAAAPAAAPGAARPEVAVGKAISVSAGVFCAGAPAAPAAGPETRTVSASLGGGQSKPRGFAVGFRNVGRFFVPGPMRSAFDAVWGAREESMRREAGFRGLSVEDLECRGGDGEECGVRVESRWTDSGAMARWGMSKGARRNPLPAGVLQERPRNGSLPEEHVPFTTLD